MAVVIGEAAIRIRADASDTAEEIQDEVGPAAEKAGEEGGDKLGERLRLGAAAGLAGLGAAFAASLEQEALGDKLAAQLGASGQYAEDLGGIAGELYADAYGDSLGTVNDALRSVIQSGAVMEDATNEQLESVTASALNLASAFDQDVAGTAQAAGRMVQTGLASSAEEAFDILTRGFQQGADRGGDLLDVLSEYGTTFSELGVSGAQATGLMTQALAAGIPNADFAADALREMGIIAREGGEEAAEALGSLGLSADDYFSAMQEGGPAASAALDTVLDTLRNTEDPALRASASAALVGTQYEDLGDAILAMDPSAAVDSLGQIDGAAARMGETLNDNAQTNLTGFWREAQQAFVNVLGGQVIPAVETAVSWLKEELGPALDGVQSFIEEEVVPAFESLDEWLRENQTTVQIVAGTITAVMLPALLRLGVQALISGAMTVAGWAMTAAGAVSAGVTYVAQSALIVARWVAMGVAAVVNAAVMATGWVIGIIGPAVIAGAAMLVQAAVIVGGWVLMGTQALLNAARMAAAWLIAMGPVGWVIAAVVGLVALIVANWDWVKEKTTAAWNAVTGAVSGAWNALTGAVSSGIDTVIGFVSGLPGRILGAIGNLGSLLLGAGRSLMQGFVNGISAAGEFVGDVAGSIWRAVRSFINSNVIDRLNNLLEFSIMGVTVNPPDIPRLHSGGVFDEGGSGEGLALLRSNELVVTPEQRVIADRLLRDLLSGSLPGAAGSAAGAGGVSVTNNITQQPGEDGAALAARVTQGTVWNLNSGVTRRVGAAAL